MKVDIYSDCADNVDTISQCLLVDCGATSHIICDKSKFVNFDNNFDSNSHYIELADGNRKNNLALGRGDASVMISDNNGQPHKVLLKNALCVPSFKQDIFSVKAATNHGVFVSFSPNKDELHAPNGKTFDIESKGNLYYLNNIVNYQNTPENKRTLLEWHKTFGHCNVNDIKSLQKVVTGMDIADNSNFSCDICIKGKMNQYRSRDPDDKATKILDLVHTDLAGPIDLEGKDGFKYAISFVNDFSGCIFVYLLKCKSDTVKATKKFLSDIAPYGSVKCILQ